MEAATFDISAALASWSTTGTHYRPTDNTPSWSAITGMCGAAFGWQRSDEQLVQFAHDYAMAIEVQRPGDRLVDYHTVQSPHRPALKGQTPRTRREELEAVNPRGEPHTTPTTREYLQHVEYKIALASVSDNPVVTVDQLIVALRKPVYPLYAGRRSCPLGPILADKATGYSVEELLPDATHWDQRLKSRLPHSIIRERRDVLTRAGEPRRFAVRNEVVR